MNNLLSLKNPIKSRISNVVKAKVNAVEYAVVPFFGNSLEESNVIMEIIGEAVGLSPSHNACKNDICTYSFNSLTGFIDPVTESESSQSDVNSFLDSLATLGLKKKTLIEISQNLYNDISDWGNAYMKVTIDNISDIYTVSIDSISQQNIVYMERAEDKFDECLISKKLNFDYFKNNKPEIIPINSFVGKANWYETNIGPIKRSVCVFHIMNGLSKSTYYGTPKVMPIINWLHVENQISENAIKTTSTELTAKHILFFEEPDPSRIQDVPIANLNNGGLQTSDGVNKLMNNLRQLTTVEGADPKSMVGLEYPNGNKAPTVQGLEVFRDFQYTESVVKLSSGYIYSAWSWAKELTGFSSVGTGIGSNLIYDLFRVKNISTIKPTQRTYSEHTQRLIELIYEKTNIQTKPLVAIYRDMISELIESTKDESNITS